MKQLLSLEPGCHERHFIHAQDRCWIETNCYVDVWIELLHAWGFDPVAGLPFTIAIDFDGDQWTFFKYPLADLCDLYGLDVQELMIWRPLLDQLEEQLSLGRPVLVEVDSFYLPDTAGMAYQLEHVKSTIAVNEIDRSNSRLGYFHGQGYHHVSGDDFSSLFHLRGIKNPAILPPYAEVVKRRSVRPLDADQLVQVSRRLLRRQLHLLPEANPFERFKKRFEQDLTWLVHEPIELFHQYSFATLRQFGACYELAATYLRWLHQQHTPGLEGSINAFESFSTGAKTMQFQLARAIHRKKNLDLNPLDQMAERWRSTTGALKALFV